MVWVGGEFVVFWIRVMGYGKLGEFWFWWMKVVFDWWIMFGVVEGFVWVKKLVILVKIWGRYEGLKVGGYGGFRERFDRWERLLLKNEGRRKEKIRYIGLEVGHGRATTGTGRANLLEFGGWLGMWLHGRATAGTGRAKLLAFQAQIFFVSSFSWIVLGQLPTK